MENKDAKLNAVNVRTLLIVLLVILVLFITGGFVFFYGQLNGLAQDIHDSTANVINERAKENSLKQQLTTFQEPLEKAGNITVSADNYSNQVIKDLTFYADKTGVKITGYTTDSTKTSSNIAGVSTQNITATLANPVNYDNFLHFLKLIETNLPKMQITGVNISSIVDSTTLIEVEPLTIRVYTK